jgi:hypothetical protein
LVLEPSPLLVGIVELGERVRDLDPADERLPALDQPVLGAVPLRERRQLHRIVEHERGLDQLRLDELREQSVDELSPSLGLVRLRVHRGGELLAARPGGEIHARALEDRVPERDPPPRRGEIDLLAVALDPGRAQHPLRDRGDEVLGSLRRVEVVGIRLVPLEHRELRVVLLGDPLVAEVLAQLVHALDPAHHAALQIELRGDPQVEVAVERVVVGGEGPGERPSVKRL